MRQDWSGVLVTGSHRSDSSWVGKMLALAPEPYYADGPFRPRPVGDPRAFPLPTPLFFTQISDDNENASEQSVGWKPPLLQAEPLGQPYPLDLMPRLEGLPGG